MLDAALIAIADETEGLAGIIAIMREVHRSLIA
jgi:hypothetical protein